MIEPEVVFNMDLANGPTSERFCFAVHALLTADGVHGVLDPEGDEFQRDRSEFMSELVDSYNGALSDNGYFAHWDAGDVVVYDLRDFSFDEIEEFWAAVEG